MVYISSKEQRVLEEYVKIAHEEAQKNERIANGTNRSTFLHLGEKKTKLVSESESSLLQR